MAERRKSRSTIEDQAEIDPEEENNEDTTSLYYQVFTLWKRRRCIEKEQLFSEKSNDSDEMYKIIAKVRVYIWYRPTVTIFSGSVIRRDFSYGLFERGEKTVQAKNIRFSHTFSYDS